MELALRFLVAWGVWMATVLLILVLRQRGLFSRNTSTAIGLALGLLLGAILRGPSFQPMGPTLAAIVVIGLVGALTFRLVTPLMLWDPKLRNGRSQSR